MSFKIKNVDIYLKNNNETNISQFDWNTYINNYPDLQRAHINTREKAFTHWIKHGINENRTWKNINPNTEVNMNNDSSVFNNFDWETYLNNYPDLQNVQINTKEKAFTHWLSHGQKEERKYTSIIYSEYINKIDKFCELYSTNKTEVLANPKLEYRYFCFKYLK